MLNDEEDILPDIRPLYHYEPIKWRPVIYNLNVFYVLLANRGMWHPIYRSAEAYQMVHLADHWPKHEGWPMLEDTRVRR